MKHLLLTLQGILCFATASFAQFTIQGEVTTPDHKAVPQASILVQEISQRTVSDASGHFKLTDIPQGVYSIEVKCLGYKTVVENKAISADATFSIELNESSIDVKEVTVWGNTNRLPDRSTIKTEVITADQFKQKGYLTISEALTTLPGVALISTGPGIARPVIRGSSGNRIATIINGVKLENQQWDLEHTLGLTQFGVDRIEVIKGPASFLYGSEAMGGVLNFVDEKPAPINTLQADAHVSFNSNTFGTLTEAGVKKASEHLNWSLRAGLNNHSDYYSNFEERVANSRFCEAVAKATLGLNYKHSVTQFSYQVNMGTYGIVEPFETDSGEEEGEEEEHPMEFEEPYHTMTHHTAVMKNTLMYGNSRISTTLSYQNDNRKELEPGDTEENPFLGFNLNNGAIDVNDEYYFNQNISLTGGVQAKLLTNSNFGYGRLIPDYKQTDLSAYALNRYKLLDQKVNIDLALRYDQTNIETTLYGIAGAADYMPALNRNFNHISSSLGVNWLITNSFSAFANVGSGYRAPNAAELTSNGVRLETQRYEIGNASFTKEYNTLTEGGINFENRTIEFELTGYYQYINNYIYASRTTDSINGYNVYAYNQNDAVIYGAEAKFVVHPTSLKWLNYVGTFTSTNGSLKNGGDLPMMPPYRINQEITLTKNIFDKIKNTFVRVNGLYVFKQDKVYTNELSTPAYFILNLGLGGEVSAWKQPLQIAVGANNMLNTEYLDHLSRLRQYNVHGMGLNAYVSIVWKFTHASAK